MADRYSQEHYMAYELPRGFAIFSPKKKGEDVYGLFFAWVREAAGLPPDEKINVMDVVVTRKTGEKLKELVYKWIKKDMRGFSQNAIEKAVGMYWLDLSPSEFRPCPEWADDKHIYVRRPL